MCATDYKAARRGWQTALERWPGAEMMLPPEPSQATDWLRIALAATISTIIGAVIGFVSAIVSEVWKTNRSERKHSRRLERALYAEMAELYKNFRGVQKDSAMKGTTAQTAELMKHYCVTDVYRYAKANPHQFYDLPVAARINSMYGYLKAIDESDSTDELILISAAAFCQAVMLSFKENDCDIEIFRKASPSAYKFLQEHMIELKANQQREEREEQEETMAKRHPQS